MKRIFFSLFLLAFVFSSAYAQQNSSFTFNELIKLRRVGDPQLSPDGKTVAFTVGDVDKAANRTLTQFTSFRLTAATRNKSAKTQNRAAARRAGRPTANVSHTLRAGKSGRWTARRRRPKQVTKISTGASNPVWSPDGRWIAFNSDVYPECASDECNAQRAAAIETGKVKAIVTERLLYRHWTDWRDKLRTHVFVVSSNGGVARDVTPGDFDAPPYGASTGTDYAFSPDSKKSFF
jgi:Tol biopolymer transport system component